MDRWGVDVRRLPTAVALVLLASAGGACAGDEADEPSLGAIEQPTFVPADDADASTTTPSAVDETGTIPLDEGAGTTEPEVTTTASGPAAPTTSSSTTTAATRVEPVSFDDPVGDATPGVTPGTPPAWSDLAGATMQRHDGAYRLRIRLGGGRAPSRAQGDTTMNIATFFDVDGDGAVDNEIWVNLDAEGWGAASFDDDRARYGDESGVVVAADGDAVVLSFPASLLGTPDRFRFSLASEYGALTTMGSDFARRDDAPDDDGSVSFPD